MRNRRRTRRHGSFHHHDGSFVLRTIPITFANTKLITHFIQRSWLSSECPCNVTTNSGTARGISANTGSGSTTPMVNNRAASKKRPAVRNNPAMIAVPPKNPPSSFPSRRRREDPARKQKLIKCGLEVPRMMKVPPTVTHRSHYQSPAHHAARPRRRSFRRRSRRMKLLIWETTSSLRMRIFLSVEPPINSSCNILDFCYFHSFLPAIWA